MRQRRIAILVAVVVVAGVIIAVLGRSGETPGPRRLAPGAGTTDSTRDPFAYDAGRRADFEARAAAGLSHVLYAKSPDGVVATAKRVQALRPTVEDVAKRAKQDPDTLEAIVFLESGGRPDVAASNDLNSAVGLTQILAQTATGLLGLKVDVRASTRLTGQIGRAQNFRHIAKLKARRRRVDERFDPRKALEATTRYLEFAKGRLHDRDDLAVESYHMGVGNLQRALKAYGNEDIPYAQLFFDSTPIRHAAAWRILASLGDDSSTYLWRIGAAKAIMKLYRDGEGGPDLDAQDALQDWPSAEHVLRPPQSTPAFTDDGAIQGQDLVLLSTLDGLRLSRALQQAPERNRTLREPAARLLSYLATAVRTTAQTAPLVATALTRSVKSEGEARVGDGVEGAPSTHTTGYAFDLSRNYTSPAQAQALQFWLDRLTALNDIAWVREPDVIHVTVGPRAKDLATR
ncbi:MAG TPA: transglycosylase SLT domain-containing protein [Baekduia sp.]|nr:transglycosylase SLT domain-containing protein [Baekduia sp.]